MPGLVLSLSLSFFPSSKTAMLQLNVIRDSSRAAGRCRRGGPTPRSQPLPLLSTLLSPFFIWLPPISPLRVTEPGDKVCLPRLPVLRLQCRDDHATHNGGRWHFLTLGDPRSPPLLSPNPISKAWVFLIYWWPHTLTLSLQLCRTAHWQD